MKGPVDFVADPDNPGWQVRRAPALDRFADIFGDIRVRVEPDGKARVRVDALPLHRNIVEKVHGGFVLALIDQVLFVGPCALGIQGAIGGLTIDTSAQFFGPLAIGRPIDAVVEVLRETGKMVFMRGLIEQDGTAAVSFAGTIRKGR